MQKYFCNFISACSFLAIIVFFCPISQAADHYPFLAVVISDGVNIRAGQSINFEQLCGLKIGEKVVVVDKSYSWYKIKLPLKADSYVTAKYIEMIGGDVGKITASRVNIRAGRGINASVLGRLEKDQLVRVISADTEWVKIEPTEESYGYIAENFVKKIPGDIPSARSVAPPVRNIYALKKMADEEVRLKAEEEAKQREKEEAGLVKFVGVVEALDSSSLNENVRHRIVAEGNNTFYLKGYRRVIDSFINQKVSVEGKKVDEGPSPHPVLLVTKITFVL